MMKRIIAAVLCLVCACTAFSGLAAGTSVIGYTLDEKLFSQLQSSGYEAQGTITASGESMGQPFDTLFSVCQALKDAAFTLDGTGEKKVKENNDTSLTFLRGESTLFDVHILQNKTAIAFSSSLLPDGYWGCDDSLLARIAVNAGLLPEELLLPLQNGFSFTEEKALFAYEEELGIFLGDYCEAAVEEGLTVLRYRVPAGDLIRECALLCESIIGDTAALKVLRVYFAGTAYEALLQDEWLPYLPSALRMVSLNGDLVILRRFDKTAAEIETEVQLPLLEGSTLSSLVVHLTLEAEGRMSAVSVTCQTGESYAFSLCTAGEKSFGSIACKDPARGWDFAFDYSLTCTGKAVNYDRVEDKATQRFMFALSLTPTDEKSHAFSAEGEVLLESGKAKTTGMNITAGVTLRDETAGSECGFSMSGKTKGAATPTALSTVTLNRLDEMDSAGLSELAERLQASFEQAVNAPGQTEAETVPEEIPQLTEAPAAE